VKNPGLFRIRGGEKIAISFRRRTEGSLFSVTKLITIWEPAKDKMGEIVAREVQPNGKHPDFMNGANNAGANG
jgi:hypothetical protein